MLLGKSRVTLRKKVSIPRLELMAAEISVLLVTAIKAELEIKISSVTFWMDATCVLQYTKNPDLRPVLFVVNRLERIHELLAPNKWHDIDVWLLCKLLLKT